MAKFPFAKSKYYEQFCDQVVEALVTFCNKTEAEAVETVVKSWGQYEDLKKCRPLLHHRPPFYHAMWMANKEQNAFWFPYAELWAPPGWAVFRFAQVRAHVQMLPEEKSGVGRMPVAELWLPEFHTTDYCDKVSVYRDEYDQSLEPSRAYALIVTFIRSWPPPLEPGMQFELLTVCAYPSWHRLENPRVTAVGEVLEVRH